MRLLVKSLAWDDLREIATRIAEDNPAAADRFIDAAQNAFDELKAHPGLGRLRSFSIPGIRSWIIPEFKNYLIFYLATRTEVIILAVLHGARDLPNAMRERAD